MSPMMRMSLTERPPSNACHSCTTLSPQKSHRQTWPLSNPISTLRMSYAHDDVITALSSISSTLFTSLNRECTKWLPRRRPPKPPLGGTSSRMKSRDVTDGGALLVPAYHSWGSGHLCCSSRLNGGSTEMGCEHCSCWFRRYCVTISFRVCRPPPFPFFVMVVVLLLLVLVVVFAGVTGRCASLASASAEFWRPEDTRKSCTTCKSSGSLYLTTVFDTMDALSIFFCAVSVASRMRYVGTCPVLHIYKKKEMF